MGAKALQSRMAAKNPIQWNTFPAARHWTGRNEVLVSPKKTKTSATGFLQQEETHNFSFWRRKKTVEINWLWNLSPSTSRWINFIALLML